MNVESDPATLMPSGELDVLIAKEWMGWKCHDGYWYDDSGTVIYKITHWSPSTDPAHAGEARRKADSWKIKTIIGRPLGAERKEQGVVCRLLMRGTVGVGVAYPSETNGDRNKVEALATCRAIDGADESSNCP